MSTECFEFTWRKNALFVCSKERQHRLLRRMCTYQSVGITVVLQPCRIGPEYHSHIDGEPTIQHSRYSSSGLAKHKEQL